MGLVVTQRPGQVAFTPVWVAAKNPIIYKMTRKDYTWTSLVNSSGNTSITISGNVTSNFVAGDTIWLQSDDGAYSASGLVVSSSFSTNTTVVTSVPYVANNASGYINTLTKRANYYVGVSVYTDTTNTVLLGTVNYYPNKRGELIIDISQPIYSDMDASLATFSSGIIVDANAFQFWNVYYSEYWTGSSPSFINDNAYASYGVFGAKQLGQSTSYSNYIGVSALTKLDYMQLFLGEYYCLSYISSSGGTTDFIKKTWYQSGTLVYVTYINQVASTNPGIYTLIQNFSESELLFPDRNITNLGTINWSSNVVVITAGAISKAWSCPFGMAPGAVISVPAAFSISGSGGSIFGTLRLFDQNGTLLASSSNTLGGTSGNFNGTFNLTNSSGSQGYFLGLDFDNSGGGTTKTITLGQMNAVLSSSVNSVGFKGVKVALSVPYSETGTLFNEIMGYINTCTKNHMTIFWRNSLGGMSSWTFIYSQDLIQKLQDPFKNNWYTLYDNSVTLGQFNALNELFSVGQVYQTTIIELTTSIDKTEARIGQQVYVIDSSGNKTGVITIGSENKTITKRNKHNFLVTIEMPEIFG